MERRILEQCYRDGLALPRHLQNAPELLMGLEFVYGAFFDLNTQRHFGFGAGPIPWTAIVDYGTAFELEGEELDEFLYLVRHMDSAFLKYQEAQSQPRK